MTYQERFADGPPDAPPAEFRPACPTCGCRNDVYFLGVTRDREVFRCECGTTFWPGTQERSA